MATYLERHARGAADSMGPGTHASITFRHFGTTVRAGSSSARARRCDDVEVRVQEGPCISAMRGMAPVVLPDLLAERRWPAWRERFTVEQFDSFVAVPVTVGPRAEIAVNFYAAGARDWTPVDLATAVRLAGAVAVDVRARLRLAGGAVGERLGGHARRERDRVDLAVGIVMASRHCDAATAQQVVRELAARSGAAPVEIAEWLAAAVVLPRASWDGVPRDRRPADDDGGPGAVSPR
ncbi:GAF and ANTAR domain-containing protein [Cellulomonas sp. IC4_254]|uniref:GAF and ANTAR domain-containing protein n=1 Tax=Cellulomonas sp. IC4_254 TaxID=2714040 RepID=UPI0014215783|nr:GAF and ANTAR domain-containing protein [Cellulomonas sp. IC4_254]NHT16665.1 GAF and ANTAR domain-containing protein [Cellulomonas sp. IC4_254]